MVFSWQMAEELAAAHMRSLGMSDAARMPDGPDGGIDVISSGAVAQVKAHARPIGSREIQQLAGAAMERGTAIFYSLSGYTPAAMSEADRLEMPLFTFTTTAEVSASSAAAHALLSGEGALFARINQFIDRGKMLNAFHQAFSAACSRWNNEAREALDTWRGRFGEVGEVTFSSDEKEEIENLAERCNRAASAEDISVAVSALTRAMDSLTSVADDFVIELDTHDVERIDSALPLAVSRLVALEEAITRTMNAVLRIDDTLLSYFRETLDEATKGNEWEERRERLSAAGLLLTM